MSDRRSDYNLEKTKLIVKERIRIKDDEVVIEKKEEPKKETK